MHEEYDDYHYDDDDSHEDLEDKYKHYFKFDPDAWDAWGKWLYDALNEVVEPSPNVWYVYGFPFKSLPVNSYFSNTGQGSSFQYLGNNYDGVGVWKNKYFVSDPLQQTYVNHIKAHPAYFLQQPSHYKGLFDILN